jgi:phage shock protein C
MADPSERKGMKRLYKSRKNKVIDGVCGGIAEYLEVDPVLVRLIAALLLIFSGGVIFIAYILGMIIIPSQPWEERGEEEPVQPGSAPPTGQTSNFGSAGSLVIGALLILLGAHFLLRNVPFFHGYYGWFWNMGWHFIWPSVLIAVGLLIVLQARRK